MMMPANYSAIAENEMTYVVGGGLIDAIGAVTAPVWGAANVKTFNTNLLTIVGNSYVTKVVNGTLGTIFGGHYLEDETMAVTDKDGKTELKRTTVFGKDKGLWNSMDTFSGSINGFNKFLQGVGALAAVYQLGTSTAKAAVAESNPIGVDGALSF